MEEANDYIGFLDQVAQELEAPAAGIARAVVAAGSFDGLTWNQHLALSIGVGKWLEGTFSGYKLKFLEAGEDPAPPDCCECPNPIPWCEVYLAGSMFSGRCTYCEQVHHKND